MALTNSRSLQIPTAESEVLHNTTSPSFQFDSLNFGVATGIGTGNIGIPLPGGNNNTNVDLNRNSNNSNNNNSSSSSSNHDINTNSNGNTGENIDFNTFAMFQSMSEAVGTLDLIPPMGQNINDISQLPTDLSLPVPLDDTSFDTGRAISNPPLQTSVSNSGSTQKRDASTTAKKADNPLLEVSKLIPVTGDRPLPDNKSYALDDDVLLAVFGVLWGQDQSQRGMTVKQICDHLLVKHPEMSSLSTKLSNLISAKLNAYVKKIEKGEVTLKYAISREWSDSSPRRMLYIYRGILAPDYKEHALRVTNQLKQRAELLVGGGFSKGNAGITMDFSKNGGVDDGNNSLKASGGGNGWENSKSYPNVKISSDNGKNSHNTNNNNNGKHSGSSRPKVGDISTGSGMSVDVTFSLNNMDFNIPYASSPVSVNLNTFVDQNLNSSFNNVDMLQQEDNTTNENEGAGGNGTKSKNTKNVKFNDKRTAAKPGSDSKSGSNGNVNGSSTKMTQNTSKNQSQARKRMTPEDSREPELNFGATNSISSNNSGSVNSKRRKSTQNTPDSTSGGTAEAAMNGKVGDNLGPNSANALALDDPLGINNSDDKSGNGTSYITAVAATPRISKLLPRSGLRGVGVGVGGAMGVAGSVNSNPILGTNPLLNNSGSNLVGMFHRFISTQTPISRKSNSGTSHNQDSTEFSSTMATETKTAGFGASGANSDTDPSVSSGLSMPRDVEVVNQSWMKVVREGFLIQDIEPPESISSERLDDII